MTSVTRVTEVGDGGLKLPRLKGVTDVELQKLRWR